MSEAIEKHDERGNLIYRKYSDSGYEYWKEYDDNNNDIYYKNVYGIEHWYKYEDDKHIKITEKEYNEIKFRKQEQEFLSRELISRFELIEL